MMRLLRRLQFEVRRTAYEASPSWVTVREIALACGTVTSIEIADAILPEGKRRPRHEREISGRRAAHRLTRHGLLVATRQPDEWRLVRRDD